MHPVFRNFEIKLAITIQRNVLQRSVQSFFLLCSRKIGYYFLKNILITWSAIILYIVDFQRATFDALLFIIKRDSRGVFWSRRILFSILGLFPPLRCPQPVERLKSYFSQGYFGTSSIRCWPDGDQPSAYQKEVFTFSSLRAPELKNFRSSSGLVLFVLGMYLLNSPVLGEKYRQLFFLNLISMLAGVVKWNISLWP